VAVVYILSEGTGKTERVKEGVERSIAQRLGG
jgi:hypothetical protein